VRSWILFASISLAPTLASAQQPAGSLAELQSRINPGDKIQVIDQNGRKIDGSFEGVSGDSLRLIRRNQPQDFPAATIREVKKRRRDPWWDGFLIGAGAGAVAGIVWTQSECSDDPECAFYTRLVFVPIATGIGMGSGALIDFVIRRYDTVFAARRTSGRLDLSPLLSQGRKGIQVRVSF
jgi:hypothetical protein